MNEHFGWAGTILRVDLTTGEIRRQPFPREWKEKFLGGRNLNSKLLFDEVPPGADPLGTENKLIIGTGLMTGLLGPATGRLTVTAKSPLTGIHGDANTGGDVAAEIKYAGYDHIVISGKSAGPVYLWIDDGRVEIRDASHLWGKTVFEADRLIKEDLDDDHVKTLMIGPAGENLVRFACVMTNLYRAAGRCGMGAVMGSKNLKALAVRGSQSLAVAKPREYLAYQEELFRDIVNAPNYPSYSYYGTPSLVSIKHQRGEMGIRNKQENAWDPEKVAAINADAFVRDLVVKSKACFACPIHCAHGYVVQQGPYRGTYGEGMEWAVIGPFGNELDNPRLDAISKCHELISQYGLDSISTGLMIAFAMELWQRGILTAADTGGRALTWGDHELIVELVHKIALREGIGDLLADGKMLMVQKLGDRGDEAADCSEHVKWLDEPTDPRSDVARTLNYAVSTRGADHLRGRPSYASWVDGGFESFLKVRYPGKEIEAPKTVNFQTYDPVIADRLIFMETICSAADALEICKFSTTWLAGSLGLTAMAKLASLACGLDVTEKSLIEIVDRGWQVERAFSVREGVTAEDDIPSARFFEPIHSGPHRGKQLDRKKFAELLQAYYEKRGWDEKGIPTREKLEGLGLQDVSSGLRLSDGLQDFGGKFQHPITG